LSDSHARARLNPPQADYCPPLDTVVRKKLLIWCAGSVTLLGSVLIGGLALFGFF